MQKMATEQTNIAEAIVQAVTEVVRVAVKAMTMAGAENSTRHKGTQNVAPKIWTHDETIHIQLKAEDKYNEQKTLG